MPAATNKRIYYAVQQVGIKGDGGSYTFTSGHEVHGAQSFGLSTNFNLEQVFELGQQAIYENIDEIPNVEASISKVLDGYPLLYHLSTVDATSPSLAGRSAAKCMLGTAIFPDTNDSATGSASSVIACSGMFVGSVSYSFPLDGNATEDVSLVGNHKVWANTPSHCQTLVALPTPVFDGQFSTNTDSPQAVRGVSRRQDIQFGFDSSVGLDNNGMVADPDSTILPPDIYGISSSGTNEQSNGQDYDAHVSNISVSVDFGREQINELGRLGPYNRFVSFTVEVTTEIEVTATSGDMVSATEDGIYVLSTGDCAQNTNLLNRTIRISTCEGTRIYLGLKNKLSSVNYGGGDAGGGNVSVSYSYSTFNDFTVVHSGDPHASGSTWWSSRSTYLVN